MVTNIEVKTGVNIILNIVHLIAFTRSDILLFHDTWLKELYSQGFRIDADVIVFLVFTSLFFTVFRGSFNDSKRMASKISNYGCFSKFEVEMVFHSHVCVIISYTLLILSEISFTWIKPHGLIRQHYHFCDVNIHIAKSKYLV